MKIYFFYTIHKFNSKNKYIFFIIGNKINYKYKIELIKIKNLIIYVVFYSIIFISFFCIILEL